MSMTALDIERDRRKEGAMPPTGRRKRKYGPIDITKPPTDEELDAQPHTHEEADRYSLFTPQQIEDETKTVRLDISFLEGEK